LGVGISSGGNFLGALKVQNELGRDAVVVTILADDNKKYLSTDLLRAEPVKDGFMAPDVRLLSVHAFKRVCQTCCNPAECADLRAPDPAPGEQLPACSKRASTGPVQL